MKKIVALCCTFFIAINLFSSEMVVLAKEELNNITDYMEGALSTNIISKDIVNNDIYEVQLNKGDSFEITNTTTSSVRIQTSASYYNNESYNYIKYSTLGNISTTRFGEKTYFDINSGEKFKIEPNCESVKLYIPNYMKVSSKININTPAFYKLNLELGKSYEFSNNTANTIPVKAAYTNDSSYDLVMYDVVNKEKNCYKNTKSNIDVKSGNHFRIGLSGGEDMRLYFPNEYKGLIKEVQQPVLNTLLINKGESYELKGNNEENKIIKIDNSVNTTYFDMVKYNENGIIENSYSDINSNISLKANCKVRITISKGEKLELYMADEDKDCYKKVEMPALNEITIKNGETYEIMGNNKERMPIINNSDSKSVMFDIARYNEDGSCYFISKDAYGTINVDPNKRAKVTTSVGDEMTIHIPYEYKDLIKKVNDPALYSFTMIAGDNYQFTGDKNKTIPIKTSASINKIQYDLLQFDDTGMITNLISDFTGEMSLKPNYMNRISLSTGNSMLVYMPYEFKACYKKVSQPALQEITINNGESYEFTSTKELPTINNSSYSGARFDFVSYTSTGELYKILKDNYGNINIQAGHRARFTTSAGVQMTIHIPYEFKDSYKKVDQPSIYTVEIAPNEYYELINNTNSDLMTINSASLSNGSRYNYFRYNSLGDIIDSVFNDYGSINLKSQEKLKIGVSNNIPLKFYLPYDKKDSIKKMDKSFYTEYKLEDGNSYVIENNTSSAVKIANTSNLTGARYNVSLYNKDGKYLGRNSNDYGAIILKSEQYAVLTLSNKMPITFYNPLETNKDAHKLEDVNKDGTVNTLDVAVVASTYNAISNSKNYLSVYDLNKDGIVDIYDLIIASRKII